MTINTIELNIRIEYEPTYIKCVPYYTSSTRNFFISEEKYEKLMEILEDD